MIKSKDELNYAPADNNTNNLAAVYLLKHRWTYSDRERLLLLYSLNIHERGGLHLVLIETEFAANKDVIEGMIGTDQLLATELLEHIDMLSYRKFNSRNDLMVMLSRFNEFDNRVTKQSFVDIRGK